MRAPSPVQDVKSSRSSTEQKPTSHLGVAVAAWIALLAIFLAHRIVLGASFFAGELATTVSKGQAAELLRVMAMAQRLDVSMATMLALPLLLVGLLELVMPKIMARLPRLWALAGALVTLAAVGATASHFFFYYYQDRFNAFFWEFWEDTENARLVVFSLPDELPLGWVVVYLLAATGGGLYLLRLMGPFATARLAHLGDRAKRLWAAALIFLLTVAMARGTFDLLPLTKQHRRGQVAAEHHLNTLHGNPFWDLYFSHEEVPNFAGVGRGELADFRVPAADARALFGALSAAFPRHALREDVRGFVEPVYRAPGLLGQVLTRKPKHVVLVVMESFTGWVLDTEDGGFAEAVAPNFRRLRDKGLYFSNYYQAGSGTIDNLTKSALQIPTPLGFPEATSFSASNKSFATSLPVIMRGFGYQPRIYYAGALTWHNIGYVFRNLGFADVSGENRLMDVEKTRFGLFDGDLFKVVADDLRAATKPSFSMVMTLSNHPPFRVPAGFKRPEGLLPPPSLAPFMNDAPNFADRYASFAYADQTIADFVGSQAEGLKDVLFVFTADHSHDGTFRFDRMDTLKTNKIPLLLYAPDLMAQSPRVYDWPGTHMDLGATLTSLLAESDQEVASFGRSLLVEPTTPPPLFSPDHNCLEDVCVVQFLPHRVGADGRLAPCIDDVACRDTARRIDSMRQAYDRLGLHYLFNFR